MIIIDLWQDWIDWMRGQLAAAGYQDDTLDSPRRISIRYFNVLRRRIVSRPRRVLKSAEFTCPDELVHGLSAFTDEAERGQDLSPRQSKQLLDADFNDGLLSDWDIHHFHMGTTSDPETPRFIQRTGNLLFARVTNDYVYLIDVVPHGSWSQQRLVRIIYANWPESIERFRLRGVLGMERTLDDDDIRKLRAAGVTTCVEVAPGIVYAPIGWGQMTSKDSTLAVLESDRYASRIHSLQSRVQTQADTMIAAIRGQGMPVGSPLEFHLIVKDGSFGVREKSSGVEFLFPDA